MKIDKVADRKVAKEPSHLREWLVPPIVIPILMVVGIAVAALVNR